MAVTCPSSDFILWADLPTYLLAPMKKVGDLKSAVFGQNYVSTNFQHGGSGRCETRFGAEFGQFFFDKQILDPNCGVVFVVLFLQRGHVSSNRFLVAPSKVVASTAAWRLTVVCPAPARVEVLL